jgi:hypothetical protein
VKQKQHSAQHRVNPHRILRAIERRCGFLPKRVRGGIRCVIENGWRYTFRLLFPMPRRPVRLPVITLRLNVEPRNPRLTVCLYATGRQPEQLEHTVLSLFRQTLPPDRIVLWMPKDAFRAGKRGLLKNWMNLTNKGLEIHPCETALADCGLASTIAAYPGDIVVTAGDAVRVQPDMLRLLYEAHQKNPEMIHCHGAAQVRVSPETGMITWSEGAEGYPVPSYCNLPILALGCLVPPHTPGTDIPAAGDEHFWLSIVAHGVKVNVIDNPCVNAEAVAAAQRGQLSLIHISEPTRPY